LENVAHAGYRHLAQRTACLVGLNQLVNQGSHLVGDV
jgi:hypothetical protein